MSDVFVGRQPIFDLRLNVFAYELLYRSGQQLNPEAARVSGDRATTDTIVNTFMEIGLDRLVGKAYAAINLTQGFLLEAEKLPFSPDQVILEVLEDIPVTPELIAAVESLKTRGYIIALDDYIYSPEDKPLLQLADIIKIDIMAMDKSALQEQVRILDPYPVKLLAEKVETPEEFNYCRKLGFEYFQGYFLSKPQIISGEKLPTNRLSLLNMLAQLNNPQAETEDLVEAINTDVTLGYKLLRLINSAAFNLPRKIDSLQHGVMLLGRRRLASWASMLAIGAMDDRPSELLRTTMFRAKMCELLAEQAEFRQADRYFTVGLFSALDLLMQRPLARLIAPLPLSEDMVSALLEHEGEMGEALACVLAYEMTDWSNIHFQDLSKDDIRVANIEAITWANMLVDSL